MAAKEADQQIVDLEVEDTKVDMKIEALHKTNIIPTEDMVAMMVDTEEEEMMIEDNK